MFGKNKYRRHRFHPLKILFFIFLFIGFILLLGWVVMYLWNQILPETIGVKPLTYWKAVGLLILSKILFGGLGKGRGWGKSRKEHWKSRWKNMSSEERERIKARWKYRCEKRKNNEDKGF